MSVEHRAHYAVHRARLEGTLVAPDACSECGAVGFVVAHHDDYAKPLDVRWLCDQCHARWHVSHGSGANGTPEKARGPHEHRSENVQIRLLPIEMRALERLRAAARLASGREIALSELALECLFESGRLRMSLDTERQLTEAAASAATPR